MLDPLAHTRRTDATEPQAAAPDEEARLGKCFGNSAFHKTSTLML
jgi:hypothetical protein